VSHGILPLTPGKAKGVFAAGTAHTRAQRGVRMSLGHGVVGICSEFTIAPAMRPQR